MKKSTIIILLVIIAAGAGIWYYVYQKKEDKPVNIVTENPQYGYIAKSVTATGTIEPVDTVSVGTQISGTIKYLYADFNSMVKKGELIAELDKSLLQAQTDQIQANLQVAESQLVYEKSNYDRQNLLYNTGAISKAEDETALYQYNSAKANVASVQAQLAAANKNLSYCSIYSPVDGVVMERNVNIGQTVAASFSTPTLFVIAKDISKMQVQAAVDEADIGNVRQAQRTTFTVDAYPDNNFTGNVVEIRLEPAVSANVVTYTTIINAPNDALKLKPGMTANIIIYTKEIDSALLISSKSLKFKPDSATLKKYKIIALNEDPAGSATNKKAGNNLRRRADTTHKMINDTSVVITPQKAFVWIKKNDSLVEKKILIGLNDDTHVQVLRGLTTDDEVIDGIQTGVITAASPAATKNPFIPQRGGGGSGKKP